MTTLAKQQRLRLNNARTLLMEALAQTEYVSMSIRETGTLREILENISADVCSARVAIDDLLKVK